VSLPGADPGLRPTRRRPFVVALATLAFGLALLAKDAVNVWWVTGAAALVTLAAAAWTDRRRLAGLLAPRRRDVLLGLGSGMALVVASHGLYVLAILWVPGLGWAVRQLYAGLQAPPGPLAAVPVVALVVLAEEVVWRGLLLDELLARLGAERSRRANLIALASLAYAIPHLVAGLPLLLLAALALGAVWATLRLTTGGLTAPVICHLVWSAGLAALWPLA